MKKEVQYLAVLAVLAVGIVALYYGGTNFTGYAVFEQSNESSFNASGANFQNVFYDSNLSAIVVMENQTDGTYTSEIFDAGNNSAWNNLTYLGSDLGFEVRACSYEDCNGANFSSVDINNLSLTGQYFQYEVTFNSNESNLTSVSLDYDLVVSEEASFEIEISNPVEGEEYLSSSSVPFEFVTNGSEGNLTCWYVLDGSNSTLGTCDSYSGNLGDDLGEHDLTVYAMDDSTNETVSDSVSFSVVSPPEDDDEDDDSESSSTTTQTTSKSQDPPIYKAEFSSEEFSPLVLSPGSSQDVSWFVNNTGNGPSSSCVFSTEGNYSSWVFSDNDSVNINARGQHEFVFTIVVPSGVDSGDYVLGVSVGCDQLTFTKEITVTIPVEEETETLDEPSQSGFTGLAIFGDEGLGTGGYAVMILAVLAVASIIFVSRKMRKDGMSFNDVFQSLKEHFKKRESAE